MKEQSVKEMSSGQLMRAIQAGDEDLPAKESVGDAYLRAKTAQVRIERESTETVLHAYMRARQTDYEIYRLLREDPKCGLTLQGPRIYADEIRDRLTAKDSAMDVIKCANALGTLNGALITQRCLDNLIFDYPLLQRVSFDFSPEIVRYGQTVTTRLRSIPSSTRYDPVTGFANSDVVNNDVSFAINQHGVVQVAYTSNDLSGTQRLLFPEVREGLHHSMALDIVSYLCALITPANFPGHVGDGTTGNPSSLTVPGKTIVTSDQMSRASVIAVKSALNQRGATGGMRTILLTEIYHDALEGSMTTITNQNDDEYSPTQAVSRLPMVAQFKPIEAPYLPAANNLQGFGFRADALAVGVRPSADYSKILPGIKDGGGEVDFVTNPETGLTACVALFIDHKLGRAYMRIAYCFGGGVGNAYAGQLICSK